MGVLPRGLRACGATEGGPEGRPHPARDRHPGPGDDSLVQGPDGGERGGRRDAVAGTGRTDPPGPCQGPRRPRAPFVASGGLNPPGTTPRKTPATSPVCRKHVAPADAGGYCRHCADEMLVRSFRPLTGGCAARRGTDSRYDAQVQEVWWTGYRRKGPLGQRPRAVPRLRLRGKSGDTGQSGT